MSVTLIQFSYKPEVLEKLIKNPEDRSVAVKQLIEQAGGRMLSFYYSYGEYDGIILAETPDNISGLATTLAAYSKGNLTNLKTTVLITVEEAMEAMKRAANLTLALPRG
ncbi:GYD domain-containing protein [Bacteroidota bacterium]